MCGRDDDPSMHDTEYAGAAVRDDNTEPLQGYLTAGSYRVTGPLVPLEAPPHVAPRSPDARRFLLALAGLAIVTALLVWLASSGPVR